LLAAAVAPLTGLPAQAAGTGTVGPVDPTTGFPLFFGDTTGFKMAPCLDGLPLCTAIAAELVAPKGEVFYNLAQADAGPFSLTLALEGAFFNGQPEAFQRTRFCTPKPGRLKAGATYTVTEPYGTHTIVANAAGSVTRNAGTS
jgi:hypothetical protein